MKIENPLNWFRVCDILRFYEDETFMENLSPLYVENGVIYNESFTTNRIM